MSLDGMIVGLGNPGSEYENTRHNFGFMIVDALLELCERKGSAALLSSRKDPFSLWRVTPPGSRGQWLVAKPLTYMNRSGDAVQRISAYYHIDIADLLVLHDELDLPLGRMKMKKGGGNAGHNGLKSIQQMMGGPDFYRLRLGVGKPEFGSGASFVLARFTAEEETLRKSVVDAAVQGVLLFLDEGPKKAQQFCNGFAPDKPE